MENLTKLKEAKHKLNEALKIEEIMWLQRSRVLWLQQGDRNTNFFHQTVNGRRKRNTISRLHDTNGNWITNEGKIKEELVGYFKDIYKREETQRIEEALQFVEQKSHRK